MGVLLCCQLRTISSIIGTNIFVQLANIFPGDSGLACADLASAPEQSCLLVTVPVLTQCAVASI